MDRPRPVLHTLGWLRAILLLERARGTGSLHVAAHGRTASIRLSQGAVVGFEGDAGPRLGELLGVSPTTVGEPSVLGASALASGRVSRSELAWALRRQLRLRARELARWGEVATTWEPSAPTERPFTDPMRASDLVAEALRAFAESVPPDLPRASTAPASAMALAWAERAALFPHEIAAVHGQARGPAGARFQVALEAAGFLDAPPPRDVRTLTQLHARVRREGARAVLGNPREPDARRRALRGVVAAVHPDRFAHDARLGRISEELVATLASS